MDIFKESAIIKPVTRPAYVEKNFLTGGGRSSRDGVKISNFIIHTEDGNGTSEGLALYCNGSHGVSYHYTLRNSTVCDVVDTDYASWSVGKANAFTINLCFAGSWAGWSTQQWMQRERDIAIAAWIAIQDARKYKFSTEAIVPPYGKRRSGITDHKWVTEVIKWGDHVDVGYGFPWLVFKTYLDAYAKLVK